MAEAKHTPAFPSIPLLPCPFCGYAGKWFRTGRDVGVECEQGGDCPGRAQTDAYEPEHAEHAAGQWNTRDDQAAEHYETVLQTREELLNALRDLEVGANTLDYCYTNNAGNFATALRDQRECSEKARAVIAKTIGSAS